MDVFETIVVSNAKPMIITTIIAMTEGTKYVSTTDAGAIIGTALPKVHFA